MIGFTRLVSNSAEKNHNTPRCPLCGKPVTFKNDRFFCTSAACKTFGPIAHLRLSPNFVPQET